MSLPSYYDLMRAFMALRDGEKDHDLEAETGLKPDSPDYQRIVNAAASWSRHGRVRMRVRTRLVP